MSLSSLRGKVIGFDCETTGLNPWRSAVYGKYNMEPARPFAFALKDAMGNSAYIRWEVDPKTRKVLRIAKDIQALSAILGDPSIAKVGHNVSFDIRMCRLVGIKVDWTRVHDTQFMAHVLTGGSLFSYALKSLASQWLEMENDKQLALEVSTKKARLEAKKNGWNISNEETHGKKECWRSDYWLADPVLLQEYAEEDMNMTMPLYLGLRAKLKEIPSLWEIYQGEIRVMKELYRMELAGVNCFPEKLISLRKFYQTYANSWKKKADAMGAKDLNVNSPKQMVELFVKQRGNKVYNRTDSGAPSIDNDELLRMSEKDPLAKAVLECKAAESMILKFINPYERFMAKDKDGCWLLHPNFRQATVTGRLSCSDPNLQQVGSPDSVKKKADIELKPREAIGPRPGHVWYLLDYSQMEVWLFAFQAKDKTMMEALLKGEDIHEAIGKQVWGHRPDWKPGKGPYRKKGKTTMFLKQYGGTAKAGAALFQCTRDEAQDIIDEFDRRLPGVSQYVERKTRVAEKAGMIENAFGRRYYLDRRFAYKAVNYDIQGPAADIIKRAMCRIGPLLRKTKPWEAKMVLTIHDELIIEVSKKADSQYRSQIIAALKWEMQVDSQKVGLPISLPVGGKITETTWAGAKDIK